MMIAEPQVRMNEPVVARARHLDAGVSGSQGWIVEGVRGPVGRTLIAGLSM